MRAIQQASWNGDMHLRTVIASFIFALAAGPGVAAAGQPSCDSLGQWASTNSATPAKLHIANRSREPVSIDWIDHDGERRAYLRLAPMQAVHQPSFVTHTWVASSGTGRCLCALRLDADTAWTIEASSCSVARLQSTPASAQARPFEPTAHYQHLLLRGWTVYVSSQLHNDTQTYNNIKQILDQGLKHAIETLPPSAVETLRETRIWLELSDPNIHGGGGVYHPSKRWLEANGMNPDKARSVQFDQRLVDAAEQQPAAVLHELAHAFHDRVLGSKHPEVISRYTSVCSEGRLRSVKHVSGAQLPAYALENHFEFFAEMSEAYFSTNDYFPFNREDLKRFDAATTELIGRLWRQSPPSPAVVAATDEDKPAVTCPASGQF